MSHLFFSSRLWVVRLWEREREREGGRKREGGGRGRWNMRRIIHKPHQTYWYGHYMNYGFRKPYRRILPAAETYTANHRNYIPQIWASKPEWKPNSQECWCLCDSRPQCPHMPQKCTKTHSILNILHTCMHTHIHTLNNCPPIHLLQLLHPSQRYLVLTAAQVDTVTLHTHTPGLIPSPSSSSLRLLPLPLPNRPPLRCVNCCGGLSL